MTLTIQFIIFKYHFKQEKKVRIRLEELEEYEDNDVELLDGDKKEKEMVARRKQFKTGRDGNVYIQK